MLAYFERRYAPNNLLLAATGNFDWDAVLAQASSLTADWIPSSGGRDYPEFVPHPKLEVISTSKFNRTHLAAMCPGYASQDPRHFAAGVLGLAIGDSDGSRMYWALVDNGLADSANLDHTAEDGLGSFSIYASCNPERSQEVLDGVRAVLAEAQRSGITSGELERAKRKLAVGLTLRAETPYGQLFPLGLEYLDLSEYKSLKDTVQAVTDVTLEDVNAMLAERPFDQLTTVALGPITSLN